MANITIRDLAQQLGVSTATVSMVLNNRPGISEETRQRVLEAVREFGYDLDRLNGTPGKKHSSIHLMIYKKTGKVVGDTPFFSSLIEGIERETTAAGYELGIRYVDPGSVPNTAADGAILLGTEMEPEDLQPYLSLHCPLVVLDNSFNGYAVNTVSIDNFGGTMLATEQLLRAGHRKIGYLSSSDRIRNFDERFAGFATTLQRHGIEPSEHIYLPANMDGARKEMHQYLQKHTISGTALVADNDLIAIGAMMELREHFVIGEELALVGFDDLPFSRVCEPQLATLRVYNDVLGRMAVRRVLEIQREPDQPFTHTTVGVTLKLRKSIGSADKQ